MNVNQLHEASYRGAFFFVASSEIGGGRKDAKKEFINSDLQIIEDLGKLQREFTITGSISDRFNVDGKVVTSYIQMRDSLLAALEKGGTGILIHPWYGRVENVVCRTFTINENIGKLGDADISITFAISNTDGIPTSNPYVLTGISTKADSVIDSAVSIFKTIWGITAGATGNFDSAVTKCTNFITAVNSATSPVAALADEINEHTRLVNNFSSDIVTLVSNPNDLADSISSTMLSINNLYSSPESALVAFTGLFDFGDDDIASPYNTFITVERKKNRTIFNSTVQASALSYSYLNASQVEYKTVEDINLAESKLEAQYQKMVRSEDAYEDIVAVLIELRAVVQGFFNEQKLNASQLITIRTNPTSTRLLAYQHYGSSADGEDIAELNGLYDLAYHQGDIRIFTE